MPNHKLVKPFANFLGRWETTPEIGPSPATILRIGPESATRAGARTTTTSTAAAAATSADQIRDRTLPDHNPVAGPYLRRVPIRAKNIILPLNSRFLAPIPVVGEVGALVHELAAERDGLEGGETVGSAGEEVVPSAAVRAVRARRPTAAGEEVPELGHRERRRFLGGLRSERGGH